MMTRTPRQAIEDILGCIEEIRVYTSRKGLDKALESGVSEAARHLPAVMTKKHSEVRWQDLKGTGNILRHEYARVSAVVMKNVIANHLKPLKRACEAIREELDRKVDAESLENAAPAVAPMRRAQKG